MVMLQETEMLPDPIYRWDFLNWPSFRCNTSSLNLTELDFQWSQYVTIIPPVGPIYHTKMYHK